MNAMFELRKAGAWFRDDRNSLLVLSAITGFGLSIFLIGKLFFSGYSILDDHDVVDWFGPNHHLAFSRIWPTLMTTEVGQYAPGARFRPVMYSLSVFQTWLWGPHPSGYHAVAILWFSIFLWAVAWACFRSIGVIAGCGILFLIVNARYWGNIFTHSTMVSEQPALLGLGLFIFGLGLISSWYIGGCRDRIDAAVLLASVGGLICVGAKENFMPPIWASILLLGWSWQKRKITLQTFLISGILGILGLAVCARIIIPNMGQATDMYGYDSHLSHRLSAIIHSPLRKELLLTLTCGVTAFVIGRKNLSEREGRDARAVITLGAILIFSGFYLAWEIFFYNGRLPYGQRYDFPALLIRPILFGAAFFIVKHLREHSAWLTRQFSPFAMQLCFVLLLMNYASFYYGHGHLLPVRSAIAISNDHTQAMAADLRSARKLSIQHPDWPILVVASHPLDYEAVVTLPTWLKFFDVPNPASVAVNVPADRLKSDFDKLLTTTMQTIGRDGVKGRYLARTAATSDAEQRGHCYIVSFEPVASKCTPLPYQPSGYYPVD